MKAFEIGTQDGLHALRATVVFADQLMQSGFRLASTCSG